MSPSKVEEIIEKYKKKFCTDKIPNECSKCHTEYDLFYDNEAMEIYCEYCLEEELVEHIDVVAELVDI